MSSDRTQRQTDEQQREALQLSLKRTRPPTEVPGYEAKRFIGAGAYGEVWAGVDRNTGRRVAIKFYAHRGGVDWPLLSREVEKLVFLAADRYVVQLLDVGWDAEPPYYVMEYVENGSLDDLLREEGPLPVNEAVELFQELVVGLIHAHGKGVLHCDLKPANVLLDQDHKPRLADFGQSRLSSEQLPALGTLFFMAPEQADLEAMPDARWDVYALGALLYCMLTGSVPFRDERALAEFDSAADIDQRLAKYREHLQAAPPVTAHRQIPGVDRALVDIIDRCLAVDPEYRYANVQSVYDALQARSQTRARRPLLLLGFVGPALFVMIMTIFAWRGYHDALSESDAAVTHQALESNRFAAKFVAGTVTHEIDRYFRAVEQVANDPGFRQIISDAIDDEELADMIAKLSDPETDPEELNSLRETFRGEPPDDPNSGLLKLAPIEVYLQQLITDDQRPKAASWFVSSPRGTHLAAVFDRGLQNSPVGKNYAWRTYFHGGPADLARDARPTEPIRETHLSAVFQSTATFAWKVAISTPVYDNDERFLGILAMTVEMGSFMKFDGSDTQFAVLVDGREGDNKGVILQHPLFDELLQDHEKLSPKFSEYHVRLDQWKGDAVRKYKDPLSDAEPEGADYRKQWLAAMSPVQLPKRSGSKAAAEAGAGLIVLVQEDRQAAIGPLHDLGVRLVRKGLTALGVLIVVVAGLWFLVIRGMRRPSRGAPKPLADQADPTIHSRATVRKPIK